MLLPLLVLLLLQLWKRDIPHPRRVAADAKGQQSVLEFVYNPCGCLWCIG